jgi:predicted DNA-binding mobile mystery protein A
MAYRIDTGALARKHFDERLAALKRADTLARPPRGWIKAIREALGMTTAQFASRIGLSQPRITQLERSEVEGTVTLNTLRHVAEGLDCRLVYYFVPNQSLGDVVRERAEVIADAQLRRTNQTMRLENQAMAPADLKAERERLVAELMRGDPRRLWDER